MIEELIIKHQKKFGELDREIVSYMLNHPDQIKKMSIVELADVTFTSKSTVLRLVQKLGFSGYSEFKYHLKMSDNVGDKQISDALSLQSIDISKTIELLEKVEWIEIVETLYNAQVVYAYGTGFSQRRVLDEFSKSLLQLGKKAIVVPNKTELDMTMSMMTDSDVLVIASLSGETENVQGNILSLQLRKIPTVSVTRFGENFMARHSDYAIHYQTTAFHTHYGQKQVESMLPLSLAMDYMYRKLVEYSSRQVER